jgi:hypothetical protein
MKYCRQYEPTRVCYALCVCVRVCACVCNGHPTHVHACTQNTYTSSSCSHIRNVFFEMRNAYVPPQSWSGITSMFSRQSSDSPCAALANAHPTTAAHDDSRARRRRRVASSRACILSSSGCSPLIPSAPASSTLCAARLHMRRRGPPVHACGPRMPPPQSAP